MVIYKFLQSYLASLAIGNPPHKLSTKVRGGYTDKKEKKIFLICKEIQSGAVAKSYMRKGFLIYEEMQKYFSIYGRPLYSHI
jgi:hypothetical protein